MISRRVGHFLAGVTCGCARRPILTVALATLLALGGLAYAGKSLGFVTSPYRLLPQDARYVVLLREYLRDFGELNDIVVVVAADDPATAKAYAARFADDLRRAGLQGRIAYRLDVPALGDNALLYLPLADLTALRNRLVDHADFLRSYASRPTLSGLLDSLNTQLANAMVLGFLDLGLGGPGRADLRFIDAVLDQAEARLEGRPPGPSPWSVGLSLGGLVPADAGWFFSADRRLLFVFVEPSDDEGDFTDNRDRLALLRSVIARLRASFPGVEAGVTGGPAISNDEMITAFADSGRAGALSMLLTVGLVLMAFRGVVKPLLMLATLVVGLAWAMGAITLVVGHLSVFSVMFISIVVGLGIDYGIYFLYRYQEEIGLGASLERALHRTAWRAGPGILLGALTAAGAFFVLRFADFKGIGEFGVVSGIAVLSSFASMISLFPALLALADRGRAARPSRTPRMSREPEARWLEWIVAHPGSILAGVAVVSALAAAGAPGVGFDDNLLRLQAAGTESVAWEERILTQGGRSAVPAITAASTLVELEGKHRAMERLSSVARVESLLTVVPEEQTEKIAVMRQIAADLAPVHVVAAPPLRLASVREALGVLHRRLGIVLADLGEGPGRRAVEQTRARAERVLRRLDGPGAAEAERALSQLQDDLARDFSRQLAEFKRRLHRRAFGADEVPAPLRRRFVGQSGRYLIRIFPSVDIWSREGATRFVSELRTVDPDVTGPPVTRYEATRSIRRGYLQGAVYAFALVAAVTAVLLRSARGTALALVPLALGVLWTLGLMRLFDLEFNLANVWAVPLIIGTAVEYGVNIYIRYREGAETGGPLLPRSTALAVVLNGLTTIAGFGSLMVARHRGIWSLGLLLTIGAAASLVASLGVLPVLMRLVPVRLPSGATRQEGSVLEPRPRA